MICLLFDFFVLITVQMDESLYDNIVNYILHKQYPPDFEVIKLAFFFAMVQNKT